MSRVMTLKRYGATYFGKMGCRGMMRALPYKKRLQYIESSGTQWVDLPFGFDPTDEIEYSFSVDTSQTSDKYMVSPSSWNTDGNRFAMGVHNGGIYTIGYGNTATGSTTLIPATVNDGNIHQWTYANKHFSIPSLSLVKDVSGNNFSFGSTTANLRLFYGYNSPTIGKAGDYKHKKNGVLVCDLIPVLDLNDEPKMFDLVTQSYPTHVGSFIAGPEI